MTNRHHLPPRECGHFGSASVKASILRDRYRYLRQVAALQLAGKLSFALGLAATIAIFGLHSFKQVINLGRRHDAANGQCESMPIVLGTDRRFVALATSLLATDTSSA